MCGNSARGVPVGLKALPQMEPSQRRIFLGLGTAGSFRVSHPSSQNTSTAPGEQERLGVKEWLHCTGKRRGDKPLRAHAGSGEKDRSKWGYLRHGIAFGNKPGKASVAWEKNKDWCGGKQVLKACHFLLTKSASLAMVL